MFTYPAAEEQPHPRRQRQYQAGALLILSGSPSEP